MMTEKQLDKTKAAGLAPEAALENIKLPKHSTKKTAILKSFVELADQGLNCFQAAIKYRDFVLRSTVSDMQRDYGIRFSREWIKVPNQFGTETDCVRYWLDAENKAKAIDLLKRAEVL